MDVPESSSSAQPKDTPEKKEPCLRPCKPPCLCPLRKMPFSPELEFENILDDDREVCIPTFEEEIEKGPCLDNNTGAGLFTKKAIPAGSVVLAEKVMCVSIDDMKEVHDLKSFEGVLDSTARAMGPEWYAKFLEFAPPGLVPAGEGEEANPRAKLGLIEGIWLYYHLKAVREYKLAGILGLKMGWLNHSCVPNCNLTLVKRYHGDKSLLPEPVVKYAVLKATKDIASNEEITISYFFPSGGYLQRQLSSLSHFTFSCHCHWCTNPSPVVEETYEIAQDVDILLGCPRLVEHRPALIFQAVHDLMAALNLVQIKDPRMAQIWSYCALVAAFHSDVARAAVFLDKAITSIRALRPVEDPFRRDYTYWRHHIDEMPGFGASFMGMSTEHGIRMAQNAEVLFMIISKPDEYLRVGQYHRLTRSMKAKMGPRTHDATFMIVPDEGFNEDCEALDWKNFPKKYIRCSDLATQVKRKAIASEVTKLLSKDYTPALEHQHSAHSLDPSRPCQPCKAREEAMNQLYADMAKRNPHLVRGLPKHTIDALTGANKTSESSCDAVPSTDTKPTTDTKPMAEASKTSNESSCDAVPSTDPEPITEETKKKKKKKNKGKKGKKPAKNDDQDS